MTRKPEKMVAFGTGATRSDATAKPDFSGYISPLAMILFGEYMLRHQVQADGELRAANNWKRGMPIERYVSSLSRHIRDFSEAWDKLALDQVAGAEMEMTMVALEEAWGGVQFNVQGFGHEWVKMRDAKSE